MTSTQKSGPDGISRSKRPVGMTKRQANWSGAELARTKKVREETPHDTSHIKRPAGRTKREVNRL